MNGAGALRTGVGEPVKGSRLLRDREQRQLAIEYRIRRSAFRLGLQLLHASGFLRGYWGHWREFFDETESMGFHVMPAHYYSPVIINFYQSIVEHIACPDILEIAAVCGIERSNAGRFIVSEYHFVTVVMTFITGQQ